MHLYLHFNSTYINFTNLFTSILSFLNEGFIHIIHLIYIAFIPENMQIFLSFDSILWFLW